MEKRIKLYLENYRTGKTSLVSSEIAKLILSDVMSVSSSLPMLRRKLKIVDKHFEGQTLDDAIPQIDNYFITQRKRIKDAIALITEIEDNES